MFTFALGALAPLLRSPAARGIAIALAILAAIGGLALWHALTSPGTAALVREARHAGQADLAADIAKTQTDALSVALGNTRKAVKAAEDERDRADVAEQQARAAAAEVDRLKALLSKPQSDSVCVPAEIVEAIRK